MLIFVLVCSPLKTKKQQKKACLNNSPLGIGLQLAQLGQDCDYIRTKKGHLGYISIHFFLFLFYSIDLHNVVHPILRVNTVISK